MRDNRERSQESRETEREREIERMKTERGRMRGSGTVCGVTAYVVSKQDVQVHWAENLVWGLLVTTKGADKLRERQKSASEQISDVFHQIWPGVPTLRSQLGSKFSEQGDSKKRKTISGWTNHRTICTAYMISIFVWAMKSPKRTPALRAQAMTVLRTFFSAALEAARGGLDFVVPKAGVRDCWTEAACDANGFISGDVVWDQHSYRTVQQEWLFARLRRIGALKSLPGRPHIVDLIWFGLNPSASADVRALAEPLALSLVSQLAHHIDSLAQRMATARAVLDISRLQSTNKKDRDVLVAQRLCTAAMFLLHTNVAWLH